MVLARREQLQLVPKRDERNNLSRSLSFGVVIHTVSRTPEALGLPSRRIGFPSKYLDTFLSNGSKVLFQDAAAADGLHKI